MAFAILASEQQATTSGRDLDAVVAGVGVEARRGLFYGAGRRVTRFGEGALSYYFNETDALSITMSRTPRFAGGALIGRA